MAAPFETTVLLRGEDTGGEIALVRNTVPAGWAGPPLHHHAFDETFYVLDGELTFQLGDELAVAGPGTLAFAPGHAVHTLANRSGAPASYLLFCTPAGFERYFDRIAAEAAGVAPPTAGGRVPETVVVGPPIGERGDLAPARRLEPAGAGISVLVRAEDGGGRIALMDNRPGAGVGPPLHRHDFDELFYVLDGDLTFQIDDERVTRRAGELAFAPRGVAHTYANLADRPARMLIACTPAGLERYFARMAAERTGVAAPDWALAPIPPVERLGSPIA